MRSINLLPPEFAQSREARRQNIKLLQIFGMLLLGLMVIWGVRAFQLSNQRDRQEAAERDAEKVRAKVNALSEFDQLDKTIKTKSATLAQAMTRDIGWSRLVKELAATMPGDSWLTGIQASTQAGASATGTPPPATGAPVAPVSGAVPGAVPAWGSINFTGVSFDFPGVATWITKMQQMPSFGNVFVPSAAKTQLGPKEVVNFSGTADLNSKVASGRYQQPVQVPAGGK